MSTSAAPAVPRMNAQKQLSGSTAFELWTSGPSACAYLIIAGERPRAPLLGVCCAPSLCCVQADLQVLPVFALFSRHCPQVPRPLPHIFMIIIYHLLSRRGAVWNRWALRLHVCSSPTKVAWADFQVLPTFTACVCAWLRALHPEGRR